MREIKFRVWDKENKRMLPVDEIELDSGKVPYVNGSDFSEKKGYYDYEFYDGKFELMQYTGLKDKNGIEIYEGDIVEFRNISKKKSTTICSIVFKDGAFKLDLDYRDSFLACYLSANLKAIGNIYQNPELLEEKDNEF